MLIEFVDNSSSLELQSADKFTVYFETSIIQIDTDTTELSVQFADTDSIPIEFNNILRATNEEETMYSKRVDFVTDDLLYRAEAVVGATEASAVWRIRRIVFGVDGDVTETWASSTADFDKQWTLRATYTYS